MAIFKPGPLVEAISGGLAGVTFKLSNSGPVAAHRGAHIAKTSKASLQSRQNYLAAVKGWHDASEDTRLRFAEYALANPVTNRFGIRRTLRPFQFWMRLQLDRMTAWPGQVQEALWPTEGIDDSWIDGLNFYAENEGIRLVGDTEEITELEVRARRFFRTDRLPTHLKPPVYIGKAHAEEPGDPIDFTDGFLDRWGRPSNGEYVIAIVRITHINYFPGPWHTFTTQYAD